MTAPTVHDVLGMALNYTPLEKELDLRAKVSDAWKSTLPSKHPTEAQVAAARELYEYRISKRLIEHQDDDDLSEVLREVLRWLDGRRKRPEALYRWGKEAVGDVVG